MRLWREGGRGKGEGSCVRVAPARYPAPRNVVLVLARGPLLPLETIPTLPPSPLPRPLHPFPLPNT